MILVLQNNESININDSSLDNSQAQNENETVSSLTSEAEEMTSSTVESKEPWPEAGVDALKNDAFPSLIFGMLGIFMVLGLIALSTMALNKLFPGKKQ